jgi:hypothetical protein
VRARRAPRARRARALSARNPRAYTCLSLYLTPRGHTPGARSRARARARISQLARVVPGRPALSRRVGHSAGACAGLRIPPARRRRGR